ncbi:MAG: glycosyltransferase family 2 protein [Candidatus Shapirobacteria bacterium]|nr:glycosyltransferase family 2 protein [Candidatus Shapirobacteria bacterium]MDD3002956.1 glycosyltransferase family 2 protein [Candidatus Shapirobacteria bacterium]MDD4383239.1 glycosyltransferase family 2 protein [Candidatus Shapirobacteria bacterium]
MINFSIIIPNYNGASFLKDCLNSLKQAINNCPGSEFEIILVDNNSKDNSLEIFETIIPKNFNYRILLNSKNYGFAGAVNQGIEKAKHKYVVLLNNDLTMEPKWFQLISKTIKENKNPKIVTFFGTVLTKDGTKFESQGLKFFYSGKCQNISNGKKFNKSTTYDLPSTQLAWGASAAFVVYNKKMLKQIGLFDENFFAYEEDVDLALRLHNLNYQTLYIPQAISYHLGGGTSNKMGIFRYKMDAKNWIYIIIKNFSKKEIIKNFPQIIEERLRNLSGLIKQIIRLYKIKSIYFLPLILFSTYGEVLVNLPKMFKKRKIIQKLDKLTQ